MTFLFGAVVGAIVFGLVLKANPKIAEKFYLTTERIEKIIEEKTGKDI